MLELENKYWAHGYSRILGMDEVGRGALAGPVTVGGVIWRQGVMGEGICDSKALRPRQRECLSRYIAAQAEAFAVASRDQDYIDTYGVVQAVQSCQLEIIIALKPDMLLLDAFLLPASLCSLPQHALVKGDQLSLSIAAASIVAKADRDRRMCELHHLYPGFGFSSHKGYGTKGHYAALTQLGPCDLHRKSFLRKWSRV